MADTRINLLSTATSSVGDDFVPIDGTTNGTRKLSAYSPSFGGNATVGGTLTVNGQLTANDLSFGLVVNGAGIALQTSGSASLRYQDAGVNKWWIYKLSTDTQLYFRDMANARMQMVMVPGATSSAALTSIYSGVAIDSTTASTGTSSGALVVGNGSSGGLGVGGNASIGGTVFFGTGSDVQASRAGAGVLDVRHPSNTTSRIDVQGATSAGLGLRQSGTRDWFVSAESNELRTSCLTANSVASYESGVLVRVRDTTASTGTSSGALVVSGGVGVAGAINAGGIISTTSSSGVAVIGGRQWSIRANASGGSPASAFVIRDDSLGSERVTIDASGNFTLLAGVLQLGNAYAAGAPTATGYIVIKDSTGTSYKIPAQAL